MLALNAGRATAMCGITFALTASALSGPTAVSADTPCDQWRFDGYTQLDHANGSKLSFMSFSSYIDPPGQDYVGIPRSGAGRKWA